METRIIIGKVKHDGKELECYVPQIKIKERWRMVMSKCSYILKETYNGNAVCTKCNGEGCKECNNRGFRRIPPVDNLPMAKTMLKIGVNRILDQGKNLRVTHFPLKSNVIILDPSENQEDYLNSSDIQDIF